jgi:acetyl-CoA acetyltransferase family protein
MTDIYLLSGAKRLPRADLLINNQDPGLYAQFSATQLGGMSIKGTLAHSKLDPALIGHVVMGMAQHSHRDSIYGAQGMKWRGGLAADVPALTVARICGSGAESIAVACEMMLAGLRVDHKRPFVVAGGAESMQYPFCLYQYRGKKVGENIQKYGPIPSAQLPKTEALQDMLLMSLYDPSAKMAMANTAEELGRRHGISREEADQFAYQSHVKAKIARDAGWFDQEIEPVSLQPEGQFSDQGISLKADTHILEEPSLQKMSNLRAAFENQGIITAGNASAVVDGAASMILGREKDISKHQDLKPLARIAGMGVAACDPQIMGWGPVPATQIALENAGIEGKDLDWVEINEAFAPQALACIRAFEKMGINPNIVNPMGNAIALGHPLGATGSILTLTCAYGLARTQKRYGLVTMCIGGGQGISLILERV